jgi:hypothetical protein
MVKTTILSILVFGLIIAVACKSTTSNPGSNAASKAVDSVAMNDSVSIEDGGIQIFYNMYLSVEMSSLFKSIGATFNKNLVNSYEKASEYEISNVKALNLGVYAVDLSYSRAFDQIDYAGNYLKTMHKLATDLGIPDEKFYLSIKRIEKNISNKDSLVKIANELYSATESYLKESDREAAAALIVMGGWTEAMYIATSMVNKKQTDLELLERIADQKTSIKNLLELLGKYKKDKSIATYIEKLTKLSVSFDKLVVDENQLDNTYKQLTEITSMIQILRKEIVS